MQARVIDIDIIIEAQVPFADADVIDSARVLSERPCGKNDSGLLGRQCLQFYQDCITLAPLGQDDDLASLSPCFLDIANDPGIPFLIRG